MSFLKNIANTALNQMKHFPATGPGASLGSLGDIVFEVSSRRVLTFNGYKRNVKARYSSHEIIGQPPILEFLGAEGEEITFVMQFRADCGINPAAQADKIREMCKKGEAHHFMLGDTVIGAHKWVITDVGEDNATIDNTGRIIQNKISVTLKEYVEAFV